jgi:hypothetical protein
VTVNCLPVGAVVEIEQRHFDGPTVGPLPRTRRWGLKPRVPPIWRSCLSPRTLRAGAVSGERSSRVDVWKPPRFASFGAPPREQGLRAGQTLTPSARPRTP